MIASHTLDAVRYIKLQPLLRRGHATLPTTSSFSGMGECSQDHKTPFSRRLKLAQSINKTISSTNDLRSEFLAFFRDRGHCIVAPSSIYPKRQEGSYFVNAGMNQFKPLFLQPQTGDSEFLQLSRAANSQPCLRVGGRHDDLNDVGYDTYHHTMFEMLGNWSFGDYGKVTACKQMWEFLTRVLGLPPSSLYITYFGGCPDLGLPADDETRDIWLNIGVSDRKLMPFGAKHNFWCADQASGGGLCGPATEIHVDYRALSGEGNLSCARCMVNAGDPQVIELWNSVFITHRMVEEAGWDKPLLLPLNHLSVDTGMGLERLTSIMQGTMTTYDTDAFHPLFAFIQSEASSIMCESVPVYSSQFPVANLEVGEVADDKKKPQSRISALFHALSSNRKRLCESSNTHSHSPSPLATSNALLASSLHRDIAYRVLVDHARALYVSLGDGLLPGRQGIPLKLRHLIHRAARAACLSGLDSIAQPRLLSRLVTQVTIPSFPTDIEGPSARSTKVSYITPDQMAHVIQQEVNRFVQRLMKLEEAFANCLQDEPLSYSNLTLTDKQVTGLMMGRYGVAVSWDMICTQARWFGLKTPSPPSLPIKDPFNTPPRIVSRTSRGRTGVGQRSYTLNGLIPMTDDSAKYHCLRSSSPNKEGILYAVPPLTANLLGVVLLPIGNVDDKATEANLNVITDKTLFQDTITAVRTSLASLGLVFDRTNFFSPCGGQASDTGSVTTPFPQVPVLDVVSVEKLSPVTNEIGNAGWIVHWVKKPTSTVAEPTSIQDEAGFTLQPDANVRAGLMLHHTAQHLLNWAFGAEMADRITSTNDAPPTVYHGSRVEADRCLVRLTMLESDEAGDEAHLAKIIEGVEARCQSAIRAQLPIVIEETAMEALTENFCVKRFPWETYPAAVRAVCIGGDIAKVTRGDKEDLFSSELCGGTHLQSTEEIFDVVITACRARKQSVKEFVAIAGVRALGIKHRGNRFIAIVTSELDDVQTALSSSVYDLEDCSKRLDTLAARIDVELGDGDLSFLHRRTIEESLDRLQELQRLVKIALRQQLGLSQEIVFRNQLKTAIEKFSSNGTVILSLPFHNVNKLVIAVKKIVPNQRLMIFHKQSAIFYDPQAPGKALDWAKATVSKLALPDHLRANAMAFKDSTTVTSEGLFAVAQLCMRKDARIMPWQPHSNGLCEAALSR